MRSKTAMRDVGILALAPILVPGTAMAQAGWQEYSFAQDGFAARYPGTPTIEEHVYATRLGSWVKERVYSYDSSGVVYAVRAADFGRSRPDTDAAIDEAADRLIAMGRLTHDVSARLNWNYGRELRVEDKDGTSYTHAIFLIGNKLYQLEVTYPPSNSDPAGSSGIHYFQQAVRLLN